MAAVLLLVIVTINAVAVDALSRGGTDEARPAEGPSGSSGSVKAFGEDAGLMPKGSGEDALGPPDEVHEDVEGPPASEDKGKG